MGAKCCIVAAGAWLRLYHIGVAPPGLYRDEAFYGLDALNALKEAIPDLILSDITMPQMDGYQLCKMIRSNAVTKHVPVIMLSGKDGLFDKLRGRMVGATAYITKPFEIDGLLQLIDLHCQQAAQRM